MSVLKLEFSNGRASLEGLQAVREALLAAGVGIGQLPLPTSAELLLKASESRALTDAETSEMLQIFELSRKDMLSYITSSGREPVIPGGGSMTSCEEGVPPYPKVYDMQRMSEQDHIHAMRKFGRLHTNSVASGPGVDEVMQLVSGGPYTWFWQHPTDGVMKISIPRVQLEGPGWWLCYGGLTPHGGFMDASHGNVVANITGPEVWHMTYPETDANPWVDAVPEVPILLQRPRLGDA